MNTEFHDGTSSLCVCLNLGPKATTVVMVNLSSVFRVFLFAGLTLFFATLAAAQTPTSASEAPSADDGKAERIINGAIAAVGGDTYLNVRTVIGRGFYTTYQDGASLVPTRFLDYIAFPDKERTEFTSQGVRIINTNSGATGWLYDGATKSLHDLKPAQIDDFKRAMRTSVENVLRGWWRKENAVLSYAGRREAGLAKRNETVRVTYPDGFWVEFEFGARDSIPAKVIYKRTRTKADSDETEEVTEEDVLAKFVSIDGVSAPFVIDHFINGKQTSRINYESIEYNRPLADTLFAKPANAKSVK